MTIPPEPTPQMRLLMRLIFLLCGFLFLLAMSTADWQVAYALVGYVLGAAMWEATS